MQLAPGGSGCRHRQGSHRAAPESYLSMYEPKADPFFDQLKADVLEGAASLDRGEGIPAEAVYAKAYALIDKIEKERGG